MAENQKVLPIIALTKDRMIVKVEKDEYAKSKGGIFLPVSAQESLNIGEVIAVGPGNEQYPVEGRCKSGARILYGKYAGTEIELDQDQYLLMRADDIIAYLPPKE